MTESNVAVLVDFENVRGEALKSLFDQISDLGRIIIKRAYADWSGVGSEAQEQLAGLGIEAVQNFRSSNSGKNSSDISLSIDAVELVHSSPIDVFVVVSADSDFVPLVRKLRAQGKQVVGAGRPDVVSANLVRSCDRYIYLEAKKSSTVSSSSKQLFQEVMLTALRASSGVSGDIVAAKLHQNMRRIDPSFDYQSLGFKTFTHFLESCDGIKISRPKGPGDIIVEEQ